MYKLSQLFQAALGHGVYCCDRELTKAPPCHGRGDRASRTKTKAEALPELSVPKQVAIVFTTSLGVHPQP